MQYQRATYTGRGTIGPVVKPFQRVTLLGAEIEAVRRTKRAIYLLR